eukprot:TRINITY_DN77591_c0_g1_i1.p2 TRINITY_DN77591_c0_g1~~TRINITY_DN77591_c0_g1_i1.p2  ORF type:complete len:224 (+),score=43.39 TRINITY_DN77591_c0_g1_i1:72-743(+)
MSESPVQAKSKLVRAAEFCDLRVLEIALKKIPPDASDRQELDAALFASARRCDDSAHLDALCRRGADVHARDAQQQTPLHAACHGNQPEPGSPVLARGQQSAAMVSFLLERRAAAEAVDSKGWTPLHVAAFVGDAASATLLLAARANPAARSKAGETPLQAIESTCWQGRGAQTMCGQHGAVVRVLMDASCGPATLPGSSSDAALVAGSTSASETKRDGCQVS